MALSADGCDSWQEETYSSRRLAFQIILTERVHNSGNNHQEQSRETLRSFSTLFHDQSLKTEVIAQHTDLAFPLNLFNEDRASHRCHPFHRVQRYVSSGQLQYHG